MNQVFILINLPLKTDVIALPLNLTINNSNQSAQIVTTCDSYLWNDNIYTESEHMSIKLKQVMGVIAQ